MNSRRLLKSVVVIGVVIGVAYVTQSRWRPLLERGRPVTNGTKTVDADEPSADAPDGPVIEKVLVSESAQANLGLTAKLVESQTFWKTIQVPGIVVDRPGQSDRGIVAPATGVVSKVYKFPGESVQPGEILFSLKLLSESLHLTQSELFKATQEITLSQERRTRLAKAESAIAEVRVLETDNQIIRLQVAVKAYRQELQSRGFSSKLIDGVANGEFVSELPIVVPEPDTAINPVMDRVAATTSSPVTPNDVAPVFELQELKVELGQQVQAGQTLCLLANHQKLAIEGRAFRDETALLERTVRSNWPVEIDFLEETTDWGDLDQDFFIRHMANSIDPTLRTFAFRIPLANRCRVVEDGGYTQTLWRFRPGQKVRISVRVEKLDNVFVLPAEAVAADGPEAYVFAQNVNVFERMPVRILLHENRHVVIADDGSLPFGTYVVQNAAEQLNRMVKSGESSGVPKGFHIHADGSLHKNEDEVK